MVIAPEHILRWAGRGRTAVDLGRQADAGIRARRADGPAARFDGSFNLHDVITFLCGLVISDWVSVDGLTASEKVYLELNLARESGCGV